MSKMAAAPRLDGLKIEAKHHENMKGPLKIAHESHNKVLGFLNSAKVGNPTRKSGKKGVISTEIDRIHI
jgi:hypothetical protein